MLGLEKREGETRRTGECIRGDFRDDMGQGADNVQGVAAEGVEGETTRVVQPGTWDGSPSVY